MLFKLPSKDGRRAMSCHLVIQSLFILALAVNPSVTLAQGSGLSLSAALSQTMAQNPGLKVFDPRFQGLDGLRITADQNPALIAGVQVEDFLGSGNLAGAQDTGNGRERAACDVRWLHGIADLWRHADVLYAFLLHAHKHFRRSGMGVGSFLAKSSADDWICVGVHSPHRFAGQYRIHREPDEAE